MNYIIFFIVVFLVVWLGYNIFVIRKEAALKKMKNNREVLLLCRIGKIDKDKVDFKKMVKLLSCANALIISIMGTLVLILNNFITNFYIWILVSTLVSVIVLIPLILIIYNLIGKILKKEGK